MKLSMIQCDACHCRCEWGEGDEPAPVEATLGEKTVVEAVGTEAISASERGHEERSVIVRNLPTGLPVGWSRFTAGFSDRLPRELDVCPDCRARIESALGRVIQAGAAVADPADWRLSIDEVERRHILAVLTFTQWNKSRAAGILGIERSTLDRKLKKYRAGDSGGPQPDSRSDALVGRVSRPV